MGVSISLNLHTQAAVDAVMGAAVDGLNMAADRLVGLSVPLTPIDRGDLRAATTAIYATEETLTATVSNDMPYAARQHEELHYRHPEGGQAKYLEAPARDNQQELFGIVAAQIRRAARS